MYVDKLMGNPALELFPFLPLHAKGKRNIEIFNNFAKNILTQVLARGTPAEDDMSYAAQMVRIRNPQGNFLSLGSMQAQVKDVLWAGYDTTGNTMSWTLFLVSSHPEVEEKVTAELREAGLLASPSCPSPRPLELSDLSQLPYLAAVVKESMRLYPVGAFIGPRISPTADIQLSNGLLLPRGVIIWPMIYLIHLHSSNWPDANRFKPERWLEASSARTSQGQGTSAEKATPLQTKHIAPVAWMPFSAGRRDCLGKVLADVSMMAILATLLGNFHFRLAKRMGSPEEVAATSELRITLKTRDGMWLHAIPRSG
eukprot:jgi/Botrbrau1/7677/Bobra.0159s0119.1